MKKKILLLFFVSVLLGCNGKFIKKSNEVKKNDDDFVLIFYEEALPEAVVFYSGLREEAKKIVSSLSDEQLTAQLILAGVDGNEILGSGMKSLFQSVPAGGVMLFRYNLNNEKEKVKFFLSECTEYISSICSIAPFMTVDHEGGLVHRFGPGINRMPSAYSFWEIALAEGREKAIADVEKEANLSANEIRELGITMNLAPVAEILDDENLHFLETRSYGPDTVFVKDASIAFIRGMEAAEIASTVKHFPGNTQVDPHHNTPIIDKDKKTLDLMTEAFSGIIAEIYPPAIMVSHALVPAVDPERIASMSPVILNEWIRGELGFEGILLADDFSMGAASGMGYSTEEAVVMALNAGIDMVMVWPPDLRNVHNAITKALKENRLSRERLIDAAERIISEKIRFNLVEKRF